MSFISQLKTKPNKKLSRLVFGRRPCLSRCTSRSTSLDTCSSPRPSSPCLASARWWSLRRSEARSRTEPCSAVSKDHRYTPPPPKKKKTPPQLSVFASRLFGKRPVTFKEKNGKKKQHFKAFNNKYRYIAIKIHFYLYFCVLKKTKQTNQEGLIFINIQRNVYLK